jgi:hypothetical protein
MAEHMQHYKDIAQINNSVTNSTSILDVIKALKPTPTVSSYQGVQHQEFDQQGNPMPPPQLCPPTQRNCLQVQPHPVYHQAPYQQQGHQALLQGYPMQQHGYEVQQQGPSATTGQPGATTGPPRATTGIPDATAGQQKIGRKPPWGRECNQVS